MVAFVISLLACVIPCVAVLLYAKRRPVGTPVTWGEAMAAAVLLFALMFIAYGILPHQWLAYADNELQWRRDKILLGPGGTFEFNRPFLISYEALRDVIATGIYIVALGAQVALWAKWQNRGKVKPKAIPTSAYGRPLLKPAKKDAEQAITTGAGA